MKKPVILIFCSLLISTSAFSQATEDAGLWSTFNLDKKLNDKFSLFMTEEFRLRENFTRVNLFYTDLGVQYQLAKFLKIALAYRLIEKNLIDDTYSYRHRVMLDITLKKKIGSFAVSYRQRLQREVRNIQTSESGFMPEWYSRNKLAIKYDLGKPITPYIAAEFRYQINNPRLVEANRLWSRSRYFVGLDYKKSDKHAFGLFYMIQREFNVSAPQNLYIVGLEYSISL